MKKFFSQICSKKQKPSVTRNLKNIPTSELVKELRNRRGVTVKEIGPYANGHISANGPALLIKVID